MSDADKPGVTLLAIDDDPKSLELIRDALSRDDLTILTSTDPATGPNGGDMGLIERKDFNTAITDVAFSQRDGQISKPFKVPDGWCIVQTVKHVPGGLLPLADVKTEIEGRIQRDRADAVRQEWLNTQRTSAKLSIRDKYLDDEVKKAIAGKVPLRLGQP